MRAALIAIFVVLLSSGGCMPPTRKSARPAFRAWAVRYQVKDVDRSVAFYTQQLGFTLDMKAGPAFAKVSSGPVVLLLSGPGSSGSRPLPGGKTQEPGGYNRVAVEVDDLTAAIDALRAGGVRFRNE